MRNFSFMRFALFSPLFLILAGCLGSGSNSQSVNLSSVGLTLAITDGDAQTTTPNTTWAKPLTVQVTSGGVGLQGIPIVFSNEDGSNASITNPNVTTDSGGFAKTAVLSPNQTNITVAIRATMSASGSTSTSYQIFHLQTRSYPDTPTMTLRDPVTQSTTYAQQLAVFADIVDIATATKWCLSETQNSRPVDATNPCNGGTGPDNGWYATKPTSFVLSSANGAKTVYIWVADQFNQVSLNPSPATIYLDTVPPGIPVVVLSDPGSGSTTDTAAVNTNISITNDGDASYWCIVALPNTAAAPAHPARTDSCWVNVKPSTVALPLLGLNEVYVWTKDLAGNMSSTFGSQVINFTTASIGDPTLSMADTGTGSVLYSRSPTVQMTIGSDSIASKWCVSETQTTRPPSGISPCVGGTGAFNGWLTSRPSTFTLSSGDGLKTVYVWVSNPLNNTNADPISASITVDTIPPAIPIVNVTDPNTGQPDFTNQSTVNLSITGDTDATAWCVVERASTATPPSLPIFSDPCWLTTRPTQVTLGGTGTRRIYVYTKDIAQNVAPSPAVASITYSTVPPTNPALVMRDTLTNSTSLTRSTTVNATVNSPTGTVVWCISETQSARPATGTSLCSGGTGPNNGWFTSTPTTFTLSSGDGLKTVYVWVADGSNNVNATASSGTITLDTTPPATPIVSISDPNSGSTVATNQVIPNLSVTGDTGATGWCRILQDPAATAPAAPALNDVCWTVTRPTTVVMDQAGLRKLYLFTRDAAGNVGSPGTTTITYSTISPGDPVLVITDPTTNLTNYSTQTAVTLSITNDSDAVLWCVSQTQTSRPGLGSSLCTGGAGPSNLNYWSTTRPTSWNLTTGDGSKRVYVWTANVANTVNADPSSASTVLDTTPPVTPTVTLADPNSSSTSYTDQSTVALAITGESADVGAWCVKEQSSGASAPTAPLYGNACWSLSKPVVATLGATGTRKVYVFERDFAGNITAFPGTATISYSTSAPATPTLTLSDPTTGSSSYARQPGVSVAITGDTGATSWCLSSQQNTAPAFGTANCLGGAGPANGWFTTRPTSTTLATLDGVKTLYLWTANSSNTVSAFSGSASITLDTLPPAVPFVSLSDITTGSTAITNQTPVAVSIQYDTDAVSWCLIEQAFATTAPAAPLFNDPCWRTPRPVSSPLGATGIRRIFVYTKDVAGNVSPAAGVSQINYSTTPPADPVLSLTNATTGSSTVTKDQIVTVSIVSPTGTLQWCLSESQSSRPTTGNATCAGGSGTTNGWYTSLPSSFTLSAGDGVKTVYIWVSDTANNVNADVSSTTITLDTTPPATPVIGLADPNTGSTTQTNQLTVNLSITGDTDAYEWCPLIEANTDPVPTTPTLSSSCWRGTRPTTQAIDATGLRKVYVFTRDLAGNVGTAGTATITYSNTTPADPTVAITDSVTGLSNYAKQTAMTLAITGDTNAVKWCVSETQTTRPTLATASCTGGTGTANGWFTTRPTTYTLSSGEALKRVYVWTGDISNNVNADASSASITLDLTPPLVPSVTLQDPNSLSTTQTNQATVNLGIGTTSDALAWCVIEQATATAAPSAPAFNNACFNTTQPTTLTLGGTGARTAYVYTRDRAYNVATSAGTAAISYSTSAAGTPTLALADPTTASTLYARQVAITTTVTGDGDATKWCVSETQTSRPALGTSTCTGGTGSANGWQTLRPTSFTLSNGDGLKSVYLWTANASNSTSASAAVTTITLDTVTPSIPTVVLSDTSTGNTAFTNSTSTTIAITGDTNATAWCVIEQASTAVTPATPLFNNACFVTTRPTTQILGASGSRKVYVYTKDIGQNVSVAAGVASITLSTTPPSDPALVLSNATTGSRAYTNTPTVTVSINNPSGAVSWCLSETQPTRPTNGTATCTGGAGPNNGWYSTSPATFALSAADGLKTVYIWVADSSNNTNANVSSTTITLLQTPPAAPTVTLADPNTGSSSVTNQGIVNMTITADTGATAWCPIVQDATAAAPTAPAVSSTCWLLARPTSLAVGATGNRSVYVFLRDAATNISASGTATINYSTTPPADPTLVLADATTALTTYAKSTALAITVANDSTAQRWCVSETQTSRPALGTAACLGGAGTTNGWYTTRPTTYTLSTGDGVKKVYVWIADAFNSTAADTVATSITLDTTRPVAPTAVLADANTGNTTATNQSVVSLSLTGESSDVGAWCVLEQISTAAAPTAPLYTNACWVLTKPTTATLGATGTREVYVYERDNAYNVSSTAATATIQYLVSHPATPTLAVADPTTGSALYARQSAINISITGDTGALKWCLSEQQSTQPPLGTSACNGGSGTANGWLTTRPTTYSLSTGDGTKTIYVWTSDIANNVSTAAGTAAMTLDTLAPAVPFITLSDTVTGSTSVTNQTPASLSIQYDTDAVKWCVMEQAFATAAPTAPLWSDPCWTSPRPVTAALAATGVDRVYVYTKDVAGNVSPAAGVSQINYTTTPPTDPTLSLTNPTTGSSTVTKDLIVTTSIVSPSGAAKWCLSETQPTRPSTGAVTCTGGAGSSSGWYTSLPSSFTLSSGDGTKTVYIWVADTANNVNTDVSTATIVLDTTPPSTPTLSMADPNSGSTTQTNQSTVSLTITSDPTTYAWCPIIQANTASAPSAPGLTDSCWRTVKPTTQVIDATGTRTLYVFTRDLAGNISPAGNASITYSVSPPADPTLVMADAVTGLTTYAKQTSMTLTITGDTNAVKWCVSETQSTRPSLGTSTCTGGTGGANGWLTTRPTTFALSSGEALKHVYVWTADSYNNVNSDATSVSITLDITPPAIPTLSASDPNTGSVTQTNQSTVTLTIGATSDALAWCPIEQATAAAAPTAPAFNSACFLTTAPTTQALSASGSRAIYVFTRDRAYNVSTAAASTVITYSNTAPSVPTLVLADPNTASTSYARQLTINSTITGDTGAVKWCLSETQTTKPALATSTCTGGSGSANGWLTTRPTTFALTSGDGSQTVYLWTGDAYNNTSASAASASITLDTVTPAIPTVSLADPNTGNTAFTNSTTVSLSISGDTNAAAWCVIEQASATTAPSAPLFNNACFVSTRPTTQALGATGARKVYVYTKDVGQNVSVAAAVASISLSTTPPSDPVLVMSNATTGSRTYTNTPTVAVSINNPSGAVEWCISETQSTRPTNGTSQCLGGGGSSNGWYTSMPSTVTLSNNDALKTVYIWVADSSNNTNPDVSSATITLLQTAPAAPTVVLADPNTGSTTTTNQNTVAMTITSDTGATAWCPVTQAQSASAPATPSTSSTCWVLTRPTSISLGTTGNRSTYVFLRDPAMNISAAGSASITLSTSAPVDPAFTMSDSTTGLTTYAKSQAVNIAITGDTGAVRWCLSESQTVQPTLGTSPCSGGAGSSSGWYTSRPTTYSLSTGDGSKRVYLWTANASNNVSIDSVYQNIILDTQAPLAFTITGLTGGGDVIADQNLGTTLIPTVNWNAASGANTYNVVIKDSTGTNVICALASTTATAYTFSGCTLTNGTSYTAYVTALDLALNSTAATNTAFAFTVSLTPPGAFTITGASGSQDTTPDQWSGTSLPTISWTASSNVYNYLVQVFASDGVTVVCSQQVKAAGVLMHDYSTTGCSGITNNTNYLVQVISRDVAGNTTTATNSPFTIHTDLTAPTISITSSPAAQAIVPTAAFGFTAADAISGVASVQCQLDSGSFGACNSTTSQSYSGLSDGSHAFVVRATDVVGFTQTASFNWAIDTVPPNAFTITGATGPTDNVIDAYLHNDNKMTANWNASSNATSYQATILNLDGSTACATATVSGSATSYAFQCILDTTVDYKIAVTAFRGYGTSYVATPMQIHPYHDTLSAVITTSASTVQSGNSVTLTMVVSQNGTQMTTGGLSPTFSIASGASTGTFGAASYVGNGTYQATFTGVTVGSASAITAASGTAQAFTSVSTTSVQVTQGSVNAANSSFTASKTLVQANNTDSATLTLTLKDINNNVVTGQTPTASASGGTSTGVIAGFTEIGNGVYTTTFSGRVAGSATTITATSTVAVSSTISMVVQAGPPVQFAVTGTTAFTTQQCVGPYTVTLRDYYNNLAQAQSNVQINFSGIASGNFSLSADCSTTDPAVTVYLGGSTAQPVYAISRAPMTASLTFSDNASVLTAASIAVTVTGVPAWIGTTGSLQWGTTTGYPSRSNLDGLQAPRGAWVDSTNKLLFIADTGNNRIVRYDINAQAMTGWIGRVASIDNLTGSGCTTLASGAVTPGWCLGGSSQGQSGTNYDGMFNAPAAITGDGTYLYISDNGNSRIARIVESTGAWAGWYGRTSSVSGMTGTGCTGLTSGNPTPGWCYGGTSQSSSGSTNWNGEFNGAIAIEYFNDTVNSNKLLFLSDTTNNRIVRLNINSATAVNFDGWSGRVGTTVPTGNGVNYAGGTACASLTTGQGTQGWCLGGTAEASPTTYPPTLTDYNNMYNAPRGAAPVAGTPNLLYIGDTGNARIVRLNATTGAIDSWAGRSSYEYPATGGAAGCTTYNTDAGWCTGGVPLFYGYIYPSAAANTAIPSLTHDIVSLHTDGTTLYWTASTQYGIQSQSSVYDYSVNKMTVATPTSRTWNGRIYSHPTSGTGCSSAPIGFATPNWCGGGNSEQGFSDGQFWNVGDLAIDYSGDRIYTTDQTLSKIQIHVASTGVSGGWIGSTALTSPTSWQTSYTPGLVGNNQFPEDLTFSPTSGSSIAGITLLGSDLYVADTGNYRIKHMNSATGAFLGWYGRTNIIPTGGGSGCTGISSGAVTPAWCTGGTSQSEGNQGIGELNSPRGVASDGTYLYVVDSGLHRVVRLGASNAAFDGWLGKTSTTVTGMSGYDSTGNTNCPANAGNAFTNAWCSGGSNTSGSGDGMMNTPYGVAVNPATNIMYVGDAGNNRLSSYSTTTGAFLGWLGRAATVPLATGSGCSSVVVGGSTPAFCTGGTAAASSGTANFSGFNSPRYVAYANNYLFVSDYGNNRVHKFDTSGNYYGWIGRVGTVTNLGTGTNCSTTAANSPTPAWCTGGAAIATAATETSWDNQFSSPQGVWADSTYLYVVDSGNDRVTRHYVATGAFAGWRGIVGANSPTGGDTGCAGLATGTVTPGWCTGGTSRSGRALGGIQTAVAVTGDSNFIYVTDTLNNRIQALPK